MNTHVSEAQLHELLDGELAPAERAEIERHLRECDACRAQFDALRQLVAGLAALPREIMPPRDLRAGIWRQVGAGVEGAGAGDGSRKSSEGEGEFRGRVSPGVAGVGVAQVSSAAAGVGAAQASSAAGGVGVAQAWSAAAGVGAADRGARMRRAGWLAAAAVLLMLFSSLTTVLVMSRRGPEAGVAAGGGAGEGGVGVAAPFEGIQARYAAAAADLETLLEERRSLLRPETATLVEENLRVIDQALREAQEALAADPGNADLSRMLLASWEKKLGLLRSVTQGEAGI